MCKTNSAYNCSLGDLSRSTSTCPFRAGSFRRTIVLTHRCLRALLKLHKKKAKVLNHYLYDLYRKKNTLTFRETVLHWSYGISFTRANFGSGHDWSVDHTVSKVCGLVCCRCRRKGLAFPGSEETVSLSSATSAASSSLSVSCPFLISATVSYVLAD